MSSAKPVQGRHGRRHIHHPRPDAVVGSNDVVVERWEMEPLLARVETQLADPQPSAAIAIGSINVDHFTHFGRGRISLGNEPARTGVEWLMLADGAPVAYRAQLATGVPWPRLTGADLLPELLGCAQRTGARFGFLGGTHEVHDGLREVLAADYPGVEADYWAPRRSEVDSPSGSRQLAADIADKGVDVLVVSLGKPRQELWIQRYGRASGAKVLLAFGASADFLAGKVDRAPEWMRDHGLEWAFRLRQEPRRLARRYLIEGPPALTRIARARKL